MFCTCGMHRRGLFKIAAGAFAAAATPLLRSPAAAQTARPAATAGAPTQGEFLLRGGHVLSMDDSIGDLASGDVHVRDGKIVAVGVGLSAPGAEVIDASSMIVMPGFVDTHWHLGETFLRGHYRADHPQYGYFPTLLRLGRHLKPDDNYKSVRFAVAEAFLAGFTTVHNWSLNSLTPEHADGEIQALTECGIRSHFSYGRLFDLPATTQMSIQDVVQTQKKWARSDGTLSVGAALRTPIVAGPSPTPANVPLPPTSATPDVIEAEVSAIREARMPYTMHVGGKGVIGILAARKLLGPDALLCHAQGMSPDEIEAVATTKTRFSTSPVIEMSYSAIRNGITQFAELEAKGVQMSLSIDSSGASASADFFNAMRALLWSNWHRTDTALKLQYKPKRLVELATIEGARTLGIGAITGSLKAGKRADLIAIRATDANIAPVRDPYYSLVFSGQSRNVDLVCADGRIVVRDGRLTGIDFRKVADEASAAADALVERGPKPS